MLILFQTVSSSRFSNGHLLSQQMQRRTEIMDVGLSMLTQKGDVCFSASCPFLAEPLQGVNNYTNSLTSMKLASMSALVSSPTVTSYNGQYWLVKQ